MIEAILWSVIWTILVIIAVRVFPFTIEHDYPIEVRKVANVQHPIPKQKNTRDLSWISWIYNSIWATYIICVHTF